MKMHEQKKLVVLSWKCKKVKCKTEIYKQFTSPYNFIKILYVPSFIDATFCLKKIGL
jgi:hypothetical protein